MSAPLLGSVEPDGRAAAFVEAAWQYAGLGWALIRADGKKAKGLGWQQTKPDAPELAAGKWSEWGQRWNLGVVLGPSGLAVLDIDHDDADAAAVDLLGRLPATPTVRTGRGRLQVYFRDPGGLTKQVRDGFELRVGPHMCVAPPSEHPDTGQAYTWLPGRAPWEVKLADLPETLIDYFAAHENGAARPRAEAIPEIIPIGAIDRTLTSLAGSMRRRGAGTNAIYAALVETLKRCEPGHTHTDRDCQRIAESVSRYSPAPPVEEAQEEQEPGAVEVFRPETVDWPPILARGVPELQYLDKPDLPARKKILGTGAAESSKSIWAQWQAARLTRAGLTVVYISQENGLEEEARRFMRLRPDFELLRLYVDEGFDLALAGHAATLIELSEGAALVVLDTLSACWSGDEDSNRAIATFDRELLTPLVRETGATALVLDHKGNPQAFTKREGVSAPRGASAKGQKVDFLLEFRATGEAEFEIHHGKARGARKQPPRSFQVVDTDEGGLDIIETDTAAAAAEKAHALAGQLVAAVLATEESFLITKEMRKAAASLGYGTDVTTDALELLKTEEPARLVVTKETVETSGGRQSCKVWRPAVERVSRGGTEVVPDTPGSEAQGCTDKGGTYLRTPSTSLPGTTDESEVMAQGGTGVPPDEDEPPLELALLESTSPEPDYRATNELLDELLESQQRRRQES